MNLIQSRIGAEVDSLAVDLHSVSEFVYMRLGNAPYIFING